MKYLTIFVMSMTVLLAVACSSGGGEPTVAPQATETQSALSTAVSTPSAPTTDPAYPATQPTPLAVDSYPGAAVVVEPANPYPDSQSGVNLEGVTPEPGAGGAVVVPPPAVPSDTTAVVQKVSEDLAKRLGVEVSAVKVGETDAVEWSDSALGCPAEGYFYTQVITPGFFISLQANGQTYDYHTDLNGNFILCSKDGKPILP